MSNLIIIRSVYGKVGGVNFIQPCPNPKTGRYPECVRLVKGDPNVGPTEMILSEEEVRLMNSGQVHYVPADKVFEIVDGTTFDLDDIVDAANWAAIEHCKWIAKDRFQRDENGELIIDGGAKRYGVADLYVERPGEIAKAKMNKKQLVFRASQYIYEDSESERIKKCKVLGRDLKNAIPADILDFLIEKAEKDPIKIINLYEGEDWKMQLFLLDAIERGVIKKSDNIYKYDDKMLGGSMEAVVLLLKDITYKKLLNSIKAETYPEYSTKQEIEQIQNAVLDNTPHQPEHTQEMGTTRIKPVIGSNKK